MIRILFLLRSNHNSFVIAFGYMADVQALQPSEKRKSTNTDGMHTAMQVKM